MGTYFLNKKNTSSSVTISLLSLYSFEHGFKCVGIYPDLLLSTFHMATETLNDNIKLETAVLDM